MANYIHCIRFEYHRHCTALCASAFGVMLKFCKNMDTRSSSHKLRVQLFVAFLMEMQACALYTQWLYLDWGGIGDGCWRCLIVADPEVKVLGHCVCISPGHSHPQEVPA